MISVLTDIQSLSQRSSARFVWQKLQILIKTKSSEPAFIDTSENPSNLIKVPQCNWQDSIYQLRRTCPPQTGSRNRTERVKTNKASKQQSLNAVSKLSLRKSSERASPNTSRIVRMKLLHTVTHHYLHKEEYSKWEQ